MYATLDQLRQRNKITDPTNTSNDGKYLNKLRAATEWVNNYCARVFEPSLAARTFDWQASYWLDFRSFDLLTLTSIVDGAGGTKLTNALIMQDGQYSDATLYGPWSGVVCDGTKDFFLWTVTIARCMTVTGVWGWHNNYGVAGANAWLPAYTDLTFGTTLQISGNITNVANIITLNADPTVSYDTNYESPAISAGNLVQLDTEWMRVVATDRIAKTMTVRRGAAGTTAAAHTSTAAVSVYQVPRVINDATLRVAQWLEALDDAPFNKTVIPAMGQTIVPSAVPSDIPTLLDPLVKVRVA
jgi:hypothetical protein